MLILELGILIIPFTFLVSPPCRRFVLLVSKLQLLRTAIWFGRQGEERKREKVNLQSQRAPVVASERKCHNFRSNRKGKSSKERSRTDTKEPKKRRVQSIHLLRNNEVEQQRRKEKMKGKPCGPLLSHH
ncbi:hypothetical protein M5K25_017574 [Dendrobium thyrsiflorum]|uniref:Secreted protein n=1 Tax=Dendrobium thyrsiflorum TaxID=117978 RepID=A0ABD0UMV5_DENTH